MELWKSSDVGRGVELLCAGGPARQARLAKFYAEQRALRHSALFPISTCEPALNLGSLQLASHFFDSPNAVMRRCVALKNSGALLARPCRVLTQRKHYTSEVKKAPQDDASSSSDAPNATPASSAPHAAGDTVKINKDAKTVETAVGDLPLSPIMDPTFWEARGRFKQKKPRPGKPENALERELRKNPFAQALATTLRLDVGTRNRLPSFFLQDFKLIAHPETGDPWWVPQNLTLNKPLATPQEEGAENSDEEVETIEDLQFTKDTEDAGNAESVLDNSVDQHELATGLAEDSATLTTRKEASIRGPSAYVLGRQDVLKAISTPRTPFFQLNRRFFGPSTSRYRSLAGEAVWREDMDTFVLDQMRQQIVQSILYLSKMCTEQGRYYVVQCFGWEDVKYKQRGAVMWFKDPAEDGASPKNEPGPFAVFDVEIENTGAKNGVAVHNMPLLLGPEYSQQVLKEAAVLKDGSIFMLAGRRTTDLQLRLWKLQGYLSDFKDPL